MNEDSDCTRGSPPVPGLLLNWVEGGEHLCSFISIRVLPRNSKLRFLELAIQNSSAPLVFTYLFSIF